MQHRYHQILILLYSSILITAGVAHAQQAPPVQVAQPAGTSIAGTQTAIPLSLTQAVELAQSRSPLTREANARTASASARLRSAKSLQNPLISLAQPFGSGTGGLDENIFITQIFELPNKRGARISQARSELNAAGYEIVGTTTDVVLSAKTAYFEALRADDEYRLAEDTLNVAKQFADAARIQFQAGDVPRSNVLRSEVEMTRAEQSVVTAQTDRDNQYATLRSVAGLPIGSSLQLTDKLQFSPVSYQLSNLETLAFTNRSDVRSAQAMVDSFQAALQLAKKQSQPDLFVEGRHATLNPATGGSSIRVGVTFPLFDLGRNRADVAAAQAALAEQQAKLDEAVRTASLDVETALNNLLQAQKQVESFQTGRLSRAQELLNMAQTGYERGATSYIELLDAQNVYRNEQAEYIRALVAYNTALANLERSVGGKLPCL